MKVINEINQPKSNIDINNLIRMQEIAYIYQTTKQMKKSKKYHEIIVKICDSTTKNEKILILKIDSLNYLNKSYKSLEATKELLNLNPYNLEALINIINYLNKKY